MAATYDPETPHGQVRLLISDLPDPGRGNQAVFSDAEIDAFLKLRAGDPRRAAASALRTVAGNAVMVRGRLTMLDASTDAPAEAQALLRLAEQYEQEADVDEGGGFGIVGGIARPRGPVA